MIKIKNLILIEDYTLLRESYKEIINNSQFYKVIGDYESCEKALEAIKKITPDIILIDISLPGMDGIEGIKHFKYQIPEVQIIVLTVHEQSNYIFEALCAGAVGYLTKTGGNQQILEALDQLQNGGAPMSSCIARKVVESFRIKKIESLSTRENEVLELLSKGKSYASIANTLFLSINTIKTHIRNIYEKLQVSNRDAAVQLYEHMIK
ncbi:response regulator transcription factor [Aquimarina sp. RZ0]|uniref:response regulator n=1 Tax=Aquimarina sp. RZ0 TaxID=2607730 RepID=UPI0011F218BB|nr:response regulator transcription factor [Aquimarina sp. RZ0]KAA1246016.1 response regulator transcription factor [Aquimarina sp. RZ0]